MKKAISEAERVRLDRIRGSLFGGGVGDALGYPVEFMGEDEIFSLYGSKGILEYKIDEGSKTALISDDTQMSLFTANGVLLADTQATVWGSGGVPSSYVAGCYLDWLLTQEHSFEEVQKMPRGFREGQACWLLDVPELFSRRASGMTCISALRQRRDGGVYGSIDNPPNDSKGCGGIMRIVPLALRHRARGRLNRLDREGAEIAAVTHGHPLGYMSAAVLVHIINRIVYPEKEVTLKEIVLEAENVVKKEFSGEPYLGELARIIELAISLSGNNESDLDNIHRLGEGWVAEETLAIAIYCSLKYQDDFSAGIIAAVNHKGDSDSTGAVTGNILGALCGYDAMEDKWKRNLELSEVILEMADDLYSGCRMNEYGQFEDAGWDCKYIKMRWKPELVKEPPETELIAIKGDITEDHGVQAIVNAANTSLLGGGGVDGAIHRAAGAELLEECRLLSGCETGKAKITGAYLLPCDYVIHTPGPIWRGGNKKEPLRLESCYNSCLELAVRNGIRSIAFPSISTGAYQFPLEEAAEIAVKTVREFVTEHPGALDVVKWVLFDDETFEVYQGKILASQ